jgi:hypothetical protein
MPDIPDIPLPFIGRVVACIKDVIVRLRNAAPVISAQCIDYDKSLNAYLICMEVFPAERQYQFTKLSVDDCDLMEDKGSYEILSSGVVEWAHAAHSPDTSKGKLNALTLETFIVPPKLVRSDPVVRMFYVVPRTPKSLVKLHLKSAQWFSSLSCDVALEED